MGLLNLAKTYGNERLELACQRGGETGANTLKNIRTMLKNKLEQVPTPEEDRLSQVQHPNIRGKHYYH